MNVVKGYLNNLSGFVANLLDDPEPSFTDVSLKSENAHDPDTAAVGFTDSSEEQSSYNFLDWIPKLTSPAENAVVYYMNALASLGSTQEESANAINQEQENSVIVNSPDVEIKPLEPSTELTTNDMPSDQTDTAIAHWMNEFSSRTEEVWKQVKQDISEIVTVMSTEPKDAVTRTASSVRQHLSAVADAAKNVDPSQFSLLPESSKSAEGTTVLEACEHTQPPTSADPPTLADLRSDLSQFFSGIVSALFKPEESTRTPLRDRREARLRILRADPATYEQEPSPPPAHLGLPNYTDWRTAYFDEVTCQPLPGIPLGAARDAANVHRDFSQVLAPQPPRPEQLLEANPFMRKYLSQLVRVEGQADGRGITDADFWSRYYYRAWLLDATEQHRQRLVERVRSKTPVSGPVSAEDRHNDIEADSDSVDWFSHSDTEDANSTQTSGNESFLERTSTVTSPSGTGMPHVVSIKRSGGYKKRLVKKRTDNDQLSASPLSDSCSEQQRLASDSGSESSSIKRETPGVREITNIQQVTNENSVSETEVHASIPAESTEDFATSGSSSLVVLSNSDEERGFDATLVGSQTVSLSASALTGIRPSTQVAPLNSIHRRNASEPTSDGWDDLCGSDEPHLLPPRPTLDDETKADNDQVLDGWDSWS